MLLASDDYYEQSPKFLQAMLTGGDSAKAITEAYGRSLAQVTKDLDAYLRVGQFKLRLFDYKNPKPRKDLETRPATAFEANLVTANLQAAGVRGEADARAAFTQLEKENAGHLELQESIAYFEYRRGKREAAVPHFARAAELGSTNWQLYRDYAFAVDEPNLRTEMLGKASSLNPSDMDTRLRYADALMREGKQAQALAALVQVTNIKKEHAFQFFQLSARANIANQRTEEAKKAAERAVEFASTPNEKDYATRLLASLSRPPAPVRTALTTPPPARTNDGDADLDPPEEDAALPARPRLARRNETQLQPRGLTDDEVRALNAAALVNNSEVVLEAKFQQLDCTGPEPVMQFGIGTTTLRLSMNDPGSISLRGAGAETMSLNCGDQKNRPVRVGYNKLEDAKKRTTGDVRYLELR
jgi:Flp pilus assembly protein TadD